MFRHFVAQALLPVRFSPLPMEGKTHRQERLRYTK